MSGSVWLNGWYLHTVACRLAFSGIGKLIFEATLQVLFDRLVARILDIIIENSINTFALSTRK